MILKLQGYSLDVRYKKETDISIAGFLTRAAWKYENMTIELKHEIFNLTNTERHRKHKPRQSQASFQVGGRRNQTIQGKDL